MYKLIGLLLLSITLSACSGRMTPNVYAQAVKICANNQGLHYVDVDALYTQRVYIKCNDGLSITTNLK